MNEKKGKKPPVGSFFVFIHPCDQNRLICFKIATNNQRHLYFVGPMLFHYVDRFRSDEKYQMHYAL